MVQQLADSNVFKIIYGPCKLDKVLSTVKLWTETLHRKKKKSLKKYEIKLDPI